MIFTLPQPPQCPDYWNKVAFWAGNVLLRWKLKAIARLGLIKSSPTRLSSHLCCLLCTGFTFWLLPHAGFIRGSKVVVEGLSITFSNRSITVGHFLKRARLFLCLFGLASCILLLNQMQAMALVSGPSFRVTVQGTFWPTGSPTGPGLVGNCLLSELNLLG